MTNNIICGQNEKKIDRNLVFVHKFSWKSFIVNFLVVKVLNIWSGIIESADIEKTNINKKSLPKARIICTTLVRTV